jgi:hypothetical protein
MAARTERREQKAAPAQTPAADTPLVQAHIDAANTENWGLLRFNILKAYPNQKRIEQAPWHVDGGDWIFFDCRTAQPRAAMFTVGVHPKSAKGGQIAWGEATIQVPNRDEGVKLVEQMSNAFQQKSPPLREPQALQAWKFNTVVLGEGMKREPQGGFSPERGDWSATKWFLERDGFSAEVFFNYSLKERKGEFSEKDPEYREHLLAALAIAVRDGPLPERTPKTDPNLTDVGPTFGSGRLLAKNAHSFQFGPGGKQIIFASRSPAGETLVFAVAPDQPADPREVARLEKELDQVAVLDADASRLLVLELLPERKGAISTADPKRLWRVDTTKHEKRQLKGPWGEKEFSFGSKPVSPDGRFIAIRGSHARKDGARGVSHAIYLLDLEAESTQSIEAGPSWPEPLIWVGTGSGLRLAFHKTSTFFQKVTQEWYLADPATGKSAASQNPPVSSDELSGHLSSDGALVASLKGKESLLITEVKTGQKRRFTFHRDDRSFVYDEVFEWVSPRYLLLHLDRIAFLDVATMKMSYPLPKKDDSYGHIFSPDFNWVLFHKPKLELYVSPVVIPEASP